MTTVKNTDQQTIDRLNLERVTLNKDEEVCYVIRTVDEWQDLIYKLVRDTEGSYSLAIADIILHVLTYGSRFRVYSQDVKIKFWEEYIDTLLRVEKHSIAVDYKEEIERKQNANPDL